MSFASIVRLSPGEQFRQTTKKYLALGTRGIASDGQREFAYARAGTALNVGRMCAQALPMSDLEDGGVTAGRLSTQITTYSTTASFIRVSATWAGAATDPGGATGGQTTGYIKNIFKDGYIYVVAGTTGGNDNGGGQMLRIKDSSTCSTGTASQFIDLTFRDDDRLSEAIDTGCRIIVQRNPYDRVRYTSSPADGTGTTTPLGVPCRDITAHYYFWLQTKGPALVLGDGTLVQGSAIINSTNAAAITTGAVGTSTGTGTGAVRKQLGIVRVVTADAAYAVVDLDV